MRECEGREDAHAMGRKSMLALIRLSVSSPA
jgi:hypothetical protein